METTTDLFFTLSLDLLCVIGLDHRFKQVNPAWEKFLGLSSEVLLSQLVMERVHPDDRALTLQHFNHCTTTTTFENRFQSNSGSYHWLLWSVTFCPQRQAIYAVIHDVTERKRSRQALQDSEDFFRCLIENVKDYAIYMLDPDGNIISWNSGAERINGYREADILGQPVSLLYPPEDVRSGKPANELHIAATQGRFEDESCRVRQDGSRFWAHAIVTALWDKDGYLRGFAKVTHDITERKQAEEALQQAYDALEQRVTERTFELMEANHLLRWEITERERAEEELRQSEARLIHQTRQLQQALDELQRAQAHLVQSEKMSSLGQLVAGVAHEINNPVGFIHGNLSHATQYFQDLLTLLHSYQQHYPEPVAAVQEQAEAIGFSFLVQDLPKLLHSMKVGADRIREIVLSLRNFSRLDEAEKKPVNIHDGIDNTLLILQNRLKPRSGKWSIAIRKEYADLPLIDCYAGQINQVFMNILSNAIDALEEKMGVDEWIVRLDAIASCKATHPDVDPPHIEIRTELQNSWISISISDNGVGIPESVRQRLFDPFFTTKPVGKGTGLGLSISYQIIKKHGGQLLCHSSIGEGTEFVIQIPIALENTELETSYLLTRDNSLESSSSIAVL